MRKPPVNRTNKQTVLTSIHIIQSVCYTIKILKEIISVDILCIRPYSVLLGDYLQVGVHSLGSCGRGGGLVLL